MPRLALLNMLIGFATLTLAAAAGAFMATDIRDAFLHDQALLGTWKYLVQASAHGHTNLFSLLHISFGLTLPYSRWGVRVKALQTAGIAAGTLAMGPLMIWRSYIPPTEGLDLSGVLIGASLSAALAALAAHAAGLGLKLVERA